MIKNLHMKQAIMTKLFNSEPLETEEIMFINKNCKQEDGSVSTAPPIDCSKSDILEACGITKEIFEAFDKKLKDRLDEKPTCVSDIIQIYEDLMNEDEMYKRILLLRLVKYQMNPMSMLLRGLM